MTKRNLFVRIVIMLLLVAVMIPTFVHRVENEGKNDDVVFALNYNNANMVLSDEEFDETLNENKKMGVKTLLIGEESLNSLINAGYVSAIKYNVLCHKYDDESEEIIKLFANNRKIHNDSYVLITKRPEVKEYLAKWIPAKFSDDEFVKKVTALGADVYIIYEGVGDASKMTIGFDERKIAYAHDKGFHIALSLMVGAFSNTEYVDYIGEIIDKYNVKFVNFKDDFKGQSQSKNASQNIKALSELIKEKDVYLVLTEMATQLSNQKPMGYAKYIENAQGKVLRSYETVDYLRTNTGPTATINRYYQIINSVVDRNLRFVLINQLTNGADSLGGKSEKTNFATAQVMKKLDEIGYNVYGEYDTVFDYNVNRRLVSAAAMALMIIMALTMLEWAFAKTMRKLEIMAYVLAALAVAVSFTAPEGIILLYPTLFALIAPCFAITAVFAFVKNMNSKISTGVLMISSSVLALGVLLICGLVQSTLLSGLDYYLNTLIFRGIKLSLLVPIAYSIVAFGIMFTKSEGNYFAKIIKILNYDIKVYWMILFGAVAAVGAIYVIRSGNVAEISSFESFFRNTLTNIMAERPRTKEFLIGWPCLLLFFYYIKNTNLKLVQWILAVGSSILFASVINSFCHVFTGVGVIYTRVFNGVILGAVVCVGALFANAIIVKCVKSLMKKGNENG